VVNNILNVNETVSFKFSEVMNEFLEKYKEHSKLCKKIYYANITQLNSIILKNEEFTVHDFSINLGEICHYFSDFYCYYHLNEHLHKKNLKHFFYEISMHMSLITYKFEKNNFIDSPESPDSLDIPDAPTATLENSINFSFTTMFKLYSERPNSMKKDMDFALSTSLMICEKVLEKVHFSSSLPYNFELMANSTNLKEEQLL